MLKIYIEHFPVEFSSIFSSLQNNCVISLLNFIYSIIFFVFVLKYNFLVYNRIWNSCSLFEFVQQSTCLDERVWSICAVDGWNARVDRWCIVWWEGTAIHWWWHWNIRAWINTWVNATDELWFWCCWSNSEEEKNGNDLHKETRTND